MRFLAAITVAASVAGSAQAQELSTQCQAILDQLIADNPANYQSCEVEVAQYELDTCEPPTTFNSARPTSHLILAMDASGSMAGQVGGETKMAIAKREALSFLQDIPREVEVGLAVYGHRGNNQDSGKAESCTASEMIHDFGSNRRQLQDSINALTPTGWTPLGGVLEFAGDRVAELDPPREGDLAPVVYLISDGEETCEGDPIAAATALYEAGVQTTVNTIGFDVDAETAAQLEAIADAAGGIYYPANDAQSLRAQLNAIRDSEAQLARYKNCVHGNSGRIAMVYHNARLDLVGCYQRNNPVNVRSAIMNAMNRAKRDETPDAVCAEALIDIALYELDDGGSWLADRFGPLTDEPLRLIEEYRESASLDALGAN